MSDQIRKTLVHDEPDPKSIANRQNDEQGSFMSLYRSRSSQHIELDESFVDKSVREGVIPESIRYGVMRRGAMEAYRGVVKSTTGDMFYFNWSPNNPFKLVFADNVEKSLEVDRLYKGCALGCDLRRSQAPLDPGETVGEDDDDDTHHKGGGGSGGPSANAPVADDQFVADQQTTEHHPGATFSGLPDDDQRGRDWHGDETITRAVDAQPVATTGGHWDKIGLLKALGSHLQETAPRVAPRHNQLEAQYMQEVLGATPDQISKGMNLPPRHRLGFETWKADRLRGNLNGMQSWLRRRT